MKLHIIALIIMSLFIASLKGQTFSSQSAAKEYLLRNINNLSKIEGIWVENKSQLKTATLSNGRSVTNESKSDPIKIIIFKSNDCYKKQVIGSDKEGICWVSPTADPNTFLFNNKFTAQLVKGEIKISYDVSYENVVKAVGADLARDFKIKVIMRLTKIFPTEADYKIFQSITGTGFAISTSGIIVTNNHIVEGGINIKVRGINEDFSKTYKAKVLLTDKNNDLALIQIDEYSFLSIEDIPFTIKTNLSPVGENIFVLGYPLRATMGDEIKLTNGIISSRTGFMGDITSYQISAPVQPGNSGGPLFDNQGNLIGIINAKHFGAENASYAVKTSYLMNLVELLPNPPKLQTVSLVNEKSLTSQVQSLKKFVYIIEVN